MKPLRLATLFVVVLAVALLAGGCADDGDGDGGGGGGGDDESTVEQGKALETVSAGKLTVCTDIPSPPFAFEEGGELKGIEIDMVKAVTGRLALQPDFRDTASDEVLSALDARKCDMVASTVAVSEERKKRHDFSEPYLEVHQSLLVRKGDEAKYDALADLNGKVVGVESGTRGADYAKQHAAGAQVKEFGGVDELLGALTAGQVEAVVHNFPVAAYHAKTTGELAVAATFDEADAEEYAFVIPKDDDALKKAVDDALTQIKSDDSYRTILTQYLGTTSGQA